MRFQFASGEAEGDMARRKIGGESKLVSPDSQSCLACSQSRSTSGALGYRRDSLYSVGASRLDAVNPTSGPSSRLFAIGMTRCRPHCGGTRCLGIGFGYVVNNRLPATRALQHAVSMIDRIDMTIMLFDHFDRGAHLLGENVNIDACGEPERRIGVAEAIGQIGRASCRERV